MKRIKAINGYTIYQATTQRDADNYNCEIGSYNVYLSSDIRDYGLSNSYPEYDNIDSLTAALNICRDSKFAIACALADELNDSTVQDMDLCLEIERRLESGDSVEGIRDCYDPETGRLYGSVSEAIAAGYEPFMDELSALDSDPYGVLDDSAEGFDPDGLLDGDLEDALDAALSTGDHAGRLYDQVHSRFEARDYHDPARFEARLAEIAEELGLSQEEIDGFTSDWWLWYEAGDPAEHELLRLEGEWRVDDDVLDDSLRQEIIAGVGSESTCDTIENCGIWGAASLEIGNAAIEVNVTRVYSAEESASDAIVAEYFCCIRHADGEWESYGYMDRPVTIDWSAEDWKDRLHQEMREELLRFAREQEWNLSEPFAYGLGVHYEYAAEQCPVEPEEETPAAPAPERRSHASYAVLQDPDDGQYITISAPCSEGLDTQEKRDDWLLTTVSKHWAFSDCGGWDVVEVMIDGRLVDYVGWQPGMLYEYRDCETGEIVWSESFPQWDH